MTNDSDLYQLFSTCKELGRFVFEVSDVFGDRLTSEEMDYWLIFNVITNSKMYDVDIKGLDFFEAVEEISKKQKNVEKNGKKSNC